MKTKMTADGIGEPVDKKSIYRDLEGDEDGILYYKDREMKLLIRQVLPQDLEIVREARKIEADKFLAVQKDEFGNKKYVKLSDSIKDESDEQILEIIRKSNPINNTNGDITIVVFNIRKSKCLLVADISANDEDAKTGKITFVFFKENVKTEQEEKRIKSKVKEIVIESNMYSELYEEFVNPIKNQYDLKPIE